MKWWNRRLTVFTGLMILVYALGYFHFVYNFLASVNTLAFSIPLWALVFFMGKKTGREIRRIGEGDGNNLKNDKGRKPPPPPIIIDLAPKKEEKVLVPA